MTEPKTEINLRSAIKEIREALGLSQQDFSRKIGKSYASVQRYENVVAPKGKELALFVYVAREAGRFDLAKEFKKEALAGVPPELIQLIREDEDDEHAVKEVAAEGQVNPRKLRSRLRNAG